MEEETNQNGQSTPTFLSKNAPKKICKQQRQAAHKAERKAVEKERKEKILEQRSREWEEILSNAVSEGERARMIESRKQRMDKREKERGMKFQRLKREKEIGQKVVIDLEFAELMTGGEIQSLVQQIVELRYWRIQQVIKVCGKPFCCHRCPQPRIDTNRKRVEPSAPMHLL